jgi:glycosyltransferase involved in cell wall biosynthesis
VALDVMARNYERELAFTTRTVEYLWCGLAVVYADYGELASYIREYEAGWIVSPDDPEGIARTLRQILASPEEARRRGANAQRLAASD